MGRRKLTLEEFIGKSNKIHKNKYNYEKSIYEKDNIKIKITCNKHGDFLQIPRDHLNGNGCPKCSGNNKKTTKDFINNAKEIHGNLYDYSLSEYKNNTTKVKIKCKIHGIFNQSPSNHINLKQGCKECSKIYLSEVKTNNNDYLLNIFNDLINKNNLEIDLSTYKNNKSKIKIKCPIHGEFEKSYISLRRGFGCSDCNNFKSKGERLIKEFLDSNNIEYIPQKTFNDCVYIKKLKFDFYLPKLNTCVEFNGKQHYYPSSKFGGDNEFKLTIKRDKIKEKYCKDNNIRFEIIKFNEDIIQKLKTIIFNIL